LSGRIRFAAGPERYVGLRRWTAHPFFAWAGLRPVQAQHTEAEHRAIENHGRGRRSVVELGVAEGASASALREVMDPKGTLYLVDPFHLSRLPALNFLQRTAHRAVHRAVGRNGGAKVKWLQKFSHEAATNWTASIDLLFLDGDHNEAAVERDWRQWSPFLEARGVVAFHDARIFPGGWTWPEYGPVRFVDREFRNNPESKWKILEEVDSLVILGRRE
jgi:predicted O-methyltransferase YrrM